MHIPITFLAVLLGKDAPRRSLTNNPEGIREYISGLPGWPLIRIFFCTEDTQFQIRSLVLRVL